MHIYIYIYIQNGSDFMMQRHGTRRRDVLFKCAVLDRSEVRESFICDMTWLFHMCDMTSCLCLTWLIHTCGVTHSRCVLLMCAVLDRFEGCDSFIRVAWRVYTCDMTHSYVWRDSSHVCDMTYSCVRHDSCMNVAWFGVETLNLSMRCFTAWRFVTHLYVTWHDSFICVTLLIHMSDMMSCICAVFCLSKVRDSLVRVVWLNDTCDMRQFYAWQDSWICGDRLEVRYSFISVTWLIRVCGVTHLYVWYRYIYVWHDSSVCGARLFGDSWLIHMCSMTHSCVAWHIHMRDMTHSCVWHDSFICMTWLIHMCSMRLIHMRDMTHSYVWHDSFLYMA